MSTVELVLYMPLLMIAVLLTVQFALSYLGNQAASAVAREANRVARVTGDPGAGQARGAQYATQVGRGVLLAPRVQVAAVGDDMRTTVSGQAVRIVPFLPGLTLTESVQGPVERFVEDAP